MDLSERGVNVSICGKGVNLRNKGVNVRICEKGVNIRNKGVNIATPLIFRIM